MTALRYRRSKITTKLSKGSLRADKRRNIFAVSTIFMSACLLMTVATYLLGVTQQAKRGMEGRYQSCFYNINLDKTREVGAHENVEKVGVLYYFDTIKTDDYKLTSMYVDKAYLELARLDGYVGNLPVEADEIAVGSDYLEFLEQVFEIGDKLTLDIGMGVKEYTITGIIPMKNNRQNFTIYTSHALVEEIDATPLYSAYFRLNGGDKWDEEFITRAINGLAEDLEIEKEYIINSSYYFYLMNESSTQQVMMIVGLCLVISLASVLVIYNLFYISIIAKINEYGRLRILGATEKQIKTIVHREGQILSAIAIPAGLVIGAFNGYTRIPGGWQLSTSIVIAVIIGIVIYTSVMLAIKKPTALASEITPVEAMRHISYGNERSRKAKGTKKHMITPFRLAVINATRNKKKTVLTIASLGICGTLLTAGAAYFNSIDYEDMARKDFPEGEILVQLGAGNPSDFTPSEYFELQNEEAFTEELINSIGEINGVEGIKKFDGVVCTVDLPIGKTDYGAVGGYSQEDAEILNSFLLEGTVDTDVLIRDNGILVKTPHAWNAVYGWTPKLGETLSFRDINGNQLSFTIVGLISDKVANGGKTGFFVPSQVLTKIEGGISDYSYQLAVKTERKKMDSVEKELLSLIEGNQSLGLDTLREGALLYKAGTEEFSRGIFLLIALMGVFGIINLINTLITNLLVRKQELGALQALGMDNRQLTQMLLIEGLFYTLATLVISITLGNLCGYVLCQVIGKTGAFGELTFRVPIQQLCLYFAVVFIAQIMTSLISVKEFNRKTLVERMRDYA